VGGGDVIRVLSPVARAVYRDGMTVRQFIATQGDPLEALRQLVRSRRAGLIGFQQGEV
jgi:hypothetical protein